ncbi:MAG TPA: hypothetical protein PK569_22850, partial [Thermoanaerobaculia bacterium]|nr:hypothetical protein [Thermoanaerobaculia bacterium]
TQGGAWLMGTPKGMNWFFREWTGARDHADSKAWQIPTVGATITPAGLVRTPHPYENPNIPFEEIERQFQKMPEARFRQEILAEFVEDAGGVFRGVMACAHGSLEEPRPGHFVLGVDWGKHQDFTVLVLLDVKKRVVVDFDRFNQIDWHLQRRRLVEMVKRWERAGARVEIVAEANSMGESQIEELRREEDPVYVQQFVTTGPSKTRIVEQLQLAIETKRIAYPNLPTIVNELQAFEQERLPGGGMRYSAPEGMHDDVVMALAIANDAAGPDRGDLDLPEIPYTSAEFGEGATF